jgi:hypothetical protein
MSQKLLKNNRKNKQASECQQVEFIATPVPADKFSRFVDEYKTQADPKE